jgi:tight adherence protein B
VKFFDELLSRAGFQHRRAEVLVLVFGSAGFACLVVILWSDVIGLGLCLGILVLASALEVLRLRADARQKSLDASWPQIFDSFQSAAVSGIRTSEQFDYLAQRGPISHRADFSCGTQLVEKGFSESEVLTLLQRRFASRHGDLLIRLLELEGELGGVGMAKTFSQAALDVRSEQGEVGQLLAKQGWVALSAKIALLAPWLIALVLVQLEQNRVAFATELGSLVLVLGLALSLFAYFLVNRLGALPLPKRVLNGS